MIPRKYPLRKSPIKKKSRSAKERQRIYGPKGYVEWIHEQPCVACGSEGYCEVAHVGRRSGMGRKGPWTETVPLCGPHPGFPKEPLYEGCHRRLHEWGRDSFEQNYTMNLDAEAKQIQSFWQLFIGCR